MLGHLIWSVNELIHEKRCVLQGIETEFGTVSPIDLELSRMLHPNEQLKIPTPRSHFIKYAAINKLLTSASENGSTIFMEYRELLDKIGAKQSRLGKLVNDISWFNGSYSFLRGRWLRCAVMSIAIKPGLMRYWERVFSAAMKVAKHIFDTPEGKHPLIYEDESSNDGGNNGKNKRWITSTDLEYMTLVMIYSLLRLAWEKNVLIIGLIKDSAAAELTKTIVPILQNAHKISILGNDMGGGIIQLPVFNSDKQLLQTSSVVNGQFVKTPWRTFEFDACFRTMAPVTDGVDNNIIRL